MTHPHFCTHEKALESCHSKFLSSVPQVPLTRGANSPSWPWHKPYGEKGPRRSLQQPLYFECLEIFISIKKHNFSG